jgi:hypothetical protein
MRVLTTYMRKLFTRHRVPVRSTEKLYNGVLQGWGEHYDDLTD